MTRSDSNADEAEAVLIPPELIADIGRMVGVTAIGHMAGSTFPREHCGCLIGNVSPSGERTVTAVLPAENEWPDPEPNRYLLSAATVREAEERAGRADALVLGFYHSHPEDDVRPSSTDLAYAWPWYTYLIVAETGRCAAWRLREDRSGFVRQEVRVMAAPGMRAVS